MTQTTLEDSIGILIRDKPEGVEICWGGIANDKTPHYKLRNTNCCKLSRKNSKIYKHR